MSELTVRRYDHYTYDDLLARVIDQDRIIHELYTGKHGVIPHPSDVYQAGLWEIYKPDEHQGHAERVGDVGELARLRAAVEAAGKRQAWLRQALDSIQDEARDAQGDWASIDPVYQPEWCKPFADIEDIASKALANAGTGEV